ncbi:hypothetical protein RR42_m3137 [Cupriavidus basilensis]|uniref:Uncharacterized protein n=1 Tax=Cupriavidus basilensis TaxID=68895 RepID=A0A0C4Y537_9BURK|nr:hypothetical protein RR42_m3137 [Cupriavidus basilensis]
MNPNALHLGQRMSRRSARQRPASGRAPLAGFPVCSRCGASPLHAFAGIE